MKYIKVKGSKIIKKENTNYRVLRSIKDHASYSLYRMNAETTDCYAFYFVNNGKDFNGGWDWKNLLIDKNADYILDLKDGNFYSIN